MIQAIETRYAGCRFRSRLEARWAVFFDHAGIPWEYEPEGFEIDGRYYLPDFRLPECGTWIEVKPELPDEETLNFLRKAASQLPRHKLESVPSAKGGRGEWGPKLMLVGPIPEVAPSFDLAWRALGDELGDMTCGFGMYSKNNRPWWLYGNGLTESSRMHEFDFDEEMYPHVADAYRKARAARFEHGENG